MVISSELSLTSLALDILLKYLHFLRIFITELRAVQCNFNFYSPPKPNWYMFTYTNLHLGWMESDESEPETKRNKGKGKKKSAQEAQCEHALAIAGPIPPFWRIKMSETNFPEHDNVFRHMLDWGLYTSRYNNNVFASWSAYQAAEIEENKKKSSGPPPDHVMYHRVTHSILMTASSALPSITG